MSAESCRRSQRNNSTEMAAGTEMKIFLRGLSAEDTVIHFHSAEDLNTTQVRHLRWRLQDRTGEDGGIGMHFYFGGREMKENRLLSDYGIKNMSVIHWMFDVRGRCLDPGKGDDGQQGFNRSMEKLADL